MLRPVLHCGGGALAPAAGGVLLMPPPRARAAAPRQQAPRRDAAQHRQRRWSSHGGHGRGPYTVGKPSVDVTGDLRRGHFKNQNMWRWKDEWWSENESHVTILYRKSVMRHGFACEEITVPRVQAEEALETGIAVLPSSKTNDVLYCWNPEDEDYNRPIERTPELLDDIRRKRQWVDLYWRVHDSYLETWRLVGGWNRTLRHPITQQEMARLLWQQAQVRIDPRWIHWRYTNRPTGITDLGHTWAWLLLPGGEDIACPRLVYHNDRVRIRIHIRFTHSAAY